MDYNDDNTNPTYIYDDNAASASFELLDARHALTHSAPSRLGAHNAMPLFDSYVHRAPFDRAQHFDSSIHSRPWESYAPDYGIYRHDTLPVPNQTTPVINQTPISNEDNADIDHFFASTFNDSDPSTTNWTAADIQQTDVQEDAEVSFPSNANLSTLRAQIDTHSNAAHVGTTDFDDASALIEPITEASRHTDATMHLSSMWNRLTPRNWNSTNVGHHNPHLDHRSSVNTRSRTRTLKALDVHFEFASARASAATHWFHVPNRIRKWQHLRTQWLRAHGPLSTHNSMSLDNNTSTQYAENGTPELLYNARLHNGTQLPANTLRTPRSTLLQQSTVNRTATLKYSRGHSLRSSNSSTTLTLPQSTITSVSWSDYCYAEFVDRKKCFKPLRFVDLHRKRAWLAIHQHRKDDRASVNVSSQ